MDNLHPQLKALIEKWRMDLPKQECPICGHGHTAAFADENEAKFIEEISAIYFRNTNSG